MDKRATELLAMHRAKLLKAVTEDFVSRSNTSYRAYAFARYLDNADRRTAFESLWDAAIILRYSNPRGFRWNQWTDRICTLRFSICKDEKEYREMVTQWWKFARPNDKKVRRTKESHYLSDEERNQITVDLIEKIAGESAAAIYVLTNNHYSALTNETQIQQFSSEYGERQESMRWRHFGGEILSYEFWLRAHIENVKSEVAEDRQSDWIKSVDATQFFAEDIRVSR